MTQKPKNQTEEIKNKQKEPRKIQEKQTKKKENIFVVFDLSKRQKRSKYIQHKTIFYLVLDLGKVLMIETLQRFHWHEHHILKVDPNISITHHSHLLPQIL